MRDGDFKDVAPMLPGENFGTLARERLEAAAALTKTLANRKASSRFSQGPLSKIQRLWGCRPLQQPLQAKGMATQQLV